MTKTNLFKEAKKILQTDKIEQTGEGNNRTFYTVAETGIEMHRQKEGTFLKCTCMHHSIYDNDSICVYKLALIGHFMK